MIENFETIKKQLGELAEEINKFKSEAVQLRIIELIFGAAANDSNEDEESQLSSTDTNTTVKARQRRRKPRKTPPPRQVSEATIASEKKKRTPSTGSWSTLQTLHEEGFFKERRTIGQIVKHCNEKLALAFKSNEISPGLTRMTRSKTLDREKNSDGQYEYFEK